MKQLSKEEFLDLLTERIELEGSQKALAQKLDISEAYLSDVLRGRREAGAKILSGLRLRAVTNYIPDKENKK